MNNNIKIFEILKLAIPDKINDNIEYLFNSNINILDVINLLYADYIIFLTGKFFTKNKYFYNFNKLLLKYFSKYNIIYFNFEDKNKIINIINIINIFIKETEECIKNEFINEIYKINNFNKNNYFDISKKIKQIYFTENIFEPNILYKKLHFSNQEIFIPFNSYVIKKMEYKLRTFCQIAEKLGAEKIIIDYLSSKTEESNLNINISAFSNKLGTNIINNNHNNENIQITLEYPNNHSDINLNKFSIVNSILNENEFLITKEEFESDLELKFLIDARCINFIQKYNTNFIINQINKIEQKIFLKAHNYGLDIGNMNLKNNYLKINISIDFIQIQNNLDIIDGTNIHILREGFNYLSNIIKKNNRYDLLLQFLHSHLYAIEKKWIKLSYNYDNINEINKIYTNIIHYNFNENEINEIVEHFFKNNLSWYNFKKFRNLILLGSDFKLEKIYFITFQYHNILNNKKYIMNDIESYIDYFLNDFINNFKKIKIIENSGESKEDLNNYLKTNISKTSSYKIIEIMNEEPNKDEKLFFIQKNKSFIKNIIYMCFKKSFKHNGGLSDNLIDCEKLILNIHNIINYYYDNDIKNLQSKLNNELNYNITNKLNYNLKKIVFEQNIEKICIEIINNINLSDDSPNISINENIEKLSLLARVQKIFLKFIIKYFAFENNIEKITQKLNIKDSNLEPDMLINFLNDFISINKVYKNYSKYELFYTWDDFLSIKNHFLV
jgi:hypothetical protein